MIQVSLPVSEGEIELRLDVDASSVIRAASARGPQVYGDLLRTLESRLCGVALETARVSAPELILEKNSSWGLREAQVVDELLRAAHYQTHRRVQVEGVVLCRCHKIERHQLAAIIKREQPTSLDALRAFSPASTACGSCRPEVTRLLEELRPQGRRWQGRTHSEWVLLLEDSLAPWHERNPRLPRLRVQSFEQGAVKLASERRLSADEEWELAQRLESYWAEGLAAPVAVFFVFS